MHRVQLYIDAHLGDSLDLARLAEEAHFSPFHFHRLFTAWMGETLGDYLRRRRLEVAALRLLSQPRTAVLSIALTVGFGSGEAFARAFRTRFGCTPSQWRLRRPGQAVKAGQPQAKPSRSERKPDQALRKPDQAKGSVEDQHEGLSHPLEELPMKALDVTVQDRPAVRVAYLRHVGPYGAEVARFWQQQFYPFLTRHRLTGRPIYGISHDDPLITAPPQCRYDTCVEIGADEVIGTGALIGEIPAGKYAWLPFEGTTDTIGAAWVALMRDWLPQSGWQIDGRPTFEHYPPSARFDPATGVFDCHIAIPLAPL